MSVTKPAVQKRGTTVRRPIVRSYKSRFAKECASHVKSGGHGVYWESENRAWLVLPIPDDDDPSDLASFSIMDLGKKRHRSPKSGPFAGLAVVLVPKDSYWIVRRRAERDSIHEGALRTVTFDCLKCGVCCTDNEVILFPVDEERFKDAGRQDLLRPPYSRKSGNKRLLTLIGEDKRCRHLGKNLMCGIYTIRPDACSSFPVGSECCIYARESDLGVLDGLAPEEFSS